MSNHDPQPRAENTPHIERRPQPGPYTVTPGEEDLSEPCDHRTTHSEEGEVMSQKVIFKPRGRRGDVDCEVCGRRYRREVLRGLGGDDRPYMNTWVGNPDGSTDLVTHCRSPRCDPAGPGQRELEELGASGMNVHLPGGGR